MRFYSIIQINKQLEILSAVYITMRFNNLIHAPDCFRISRREYFVFATDTKCLTTITYGIIGIFLVILVIAYLFYELVHVYPESFDNSTTQAPDYLNNRYALFYAYYEKNEEYKNNLRYFLTNGGLRDDIDYFFVLNGPCSVDIPEKSNITIIRRENKGYDFGAWGHALESIELNYDYYIFVNNSVIGPYLPEGRTDWLAPFMELFNDSPDIKLVGTSINIYTAYGQSLYPEITPPYPHVQSMFFVLNDESLKYLLQNTNVFNETILNEFGDIKQVILNSEIWLSHAILKNKWNINCILPKYRGIDYREIKHDINNTSMYSGDPYFQNAYFGTTIQPTDVIFYKSYRFTDQNIHTG